MVGLWATTRRIQAARFERYLKLALEPEFMGMASPTVNDNQPSA